MGQGAYGKLSECRRWCPDWKALGTALFFDAPKNNKGFFYYGPLKMCKAKGWFLSITEQRLKRALP